MIKLCIFSAFYPPHIGGVERFVSELSDNLLYHFPKPDVDQSQCESKIIIVTSNLYHNDYKKIHSNKIIYFIPIYRFLRERFPIPKPTRILFKILKEIKKENPDVYIINMRVYLASLLGALVSKFKKKPLILIEHLSGLPSLGNKAQDFIWSIYVQIITVLLKKFINKYYGVSKAVVEHLEAYKIKSDGIIYNGISERPVEKDLANYRLLYNLNSDDIVVAYAGRLIEEKGVLALLRSFQQIPELIYNKRNHLFIAGEGPLDVIIQKYIVNSKNITLLGRLTHTDVHNLLYQADIVVMPSKYPEGLPTLILEAGINECAVIATSMGGTKEIISSDDLGMIINSDSVEEISEAIKHLIQNEDYRRKIAVNLRNKVLNEFSWKDISNKFLNELKNIIRK